MENPCGQGERAGQHSSVLEETFYITSKKSTLYRVKLTERGLSLRKESSGLTKTETIALGDIIGCRCMRSKKCSRGSCACRPGGAKGQLRLVESTELVQPHDEYDTSAYLYIYAYTLKRSKAVNKSSRRRERTTITLRFRSFDKYEDNLREASRWRVAIKCLINRVPVPWPLMSPTRANLQTLLNACPDERRKLLVILNPKSGPGRGREHFQRRVHPILAEAEKPYDVFITKYSNYARDFVRTRDIYQWSGIILVGGDGIVFEAINGLLERPDWERAMEEIPIGVIPCGSGNGLAKSIAHAKQEPYDQNPVLISALSAVRCKKRKMDLVRVETLNQIVYSFLSVGWGLLADIDIESERLRAIGYQRFAIWSMARLMNLRTYKGTVSYVPCDPKDLPPAATHRNGDMYSQKEVHIGRLGDDVKMSHSRSFGDELDRYSNGLRESRSYHDVLEDGLCLNGCKSTDSDEVNDSYDGQVIPDTLSLETETQSRHRLDSFFSTNSRKSTYFSTGSGSLSSTYHSLEDISKALEGNGDTNNGGIRIMYGPAPTVPALTAQVPTSWTKIQGEFVMVHAAYQSHLGVDCFFAPQAKLADGIIWLLVIKAGISRANLLQFLLGMNSGTHLTCTGVEMIPVKAFRIEPENGSTGLLTVDGEKVDYGPIQGQIFSSLATIMCP